MALSELSEGRKLVKHVMFCSDAQLQGDCYQLPLFDSRTKVMSKGVHSLGAWAKKIASLFISSKFLFFFIELFLMNSLINKNLIIILKLNLIDINIKLNSVLKCLLLT